LSSSFCYYFFNGSKYHFLCRVNDMLGTHGYMNFLQNSPLLSQNLHFVGGPSHYGPSNPPTRNERSPSVEEVSNPPTTGHHNLNVENEEVGRTDKRIKWTQDEDLRLVSHLLAMFSFLRHVFLYN